MRKEIVKMNQLMDLKNNRMPELPTFEEDNFDLAAHKNAAAATTQTKAKIKRDRRKISVGRIIVMLIAFVVCALLYVMFSQVAGLF